MRILITGATGFLGTHLAAHLHSQGHRVGCLSRPNSALPESIADLPNWPVDDNGHGFKEALNDFAPEVIVHLAALYVAEHRPDDISPLVRSNIEFGAHLLDAMREAGCNAMVYAGTSWQHFRNEAYCPANLYAATKQAFTTIAAYYIDSAGLRLLELDLYDSYGENDPRRKLVNILKIAAQSSDTLPMTGGEQHAHFVHVEDLSRGLELACELVCKSEPGQHLVYRLPSMGVVSLRQLVTAFNAARPERPVKVAWGALPYRTREVFQPWEAAEVLPNWQPKISLHEGLCRVRADANQDKTVREFAEDE